MGTFLAHRSFTKACWVVFLVLQGGRTSYLLLPYSVCSYLLCFQWWCVLHISSSLHLILCVSPDNKGGRKSALCVYEQLLVFPICGRTDLILYRSHFQLTQPSKTLHESSIKMCISGGLIRGEICSLKAGSTSWQGHGVRVAWRGTELLFTGVRAQRLCMHTLKSWQLLKALLHARLAGLHWACKIQFLLGQIMFLVIKHFKSAQISLLLLIPPCHIILSWYIPPSETSNISYSLWKRKKQYSSVPSRSSRDAQEWTSACNITTASMRQLREIQSHSPWNTKREEKKSQLLASHLVLEERLTSPLPKHSFKGYLKRKLHGYKSPWNHLHTWPSC